MQIQPYLFFDGRCEEALDFYKGAVGAKVDMLMRFKENPDRGKGGMEPPGSDDKVMHAAFTVGDAMILASDGNCAGKPKFDGFSLAITVKDEAEADKTFAALAKGGQVNMPLTKTFFSPKFGMVADKFGVNWMVMVDA
ncbi:MAG: VOC family protein [Reyranella sp.]|nr:VOC family protein [Reyranella sp.]MDP3162676.1 VOC family protein [Reyranella sp.]